MKSIVKTLVGRTAMNPVAWPIYKCCGLLSRQFNRVYEHAAFVRETVERERTVSHLIEELFPSSAVAHGPFSGMRFIKTQLPGSPRLPKLLGSYESELHPVLAELSDSEYSSIVNVGSAEGYYAVGLARVFPNAQIYAFDLDPRAQQLCREMAELNGVADRVHVGGLCDRKVLLSLPLGRKSLILSDCEGYERILFDAEVVAFLINHDVVIETHDFVQSDISSNMRQVFSRTHHVRSIKSIDDNDKVQAYSYPELGGYRSEMKRLILGERRPGIMEWLIMTPMHEASTQNPVARQAMERAV